MTSEQSTTSSWSTEAGVLAAQTVRIPASSRSTRYCILCNSIIPDARLKANPNAKQCVPCLEESGDVVLAHETNSRSTNVSDEVFIQMFDGGEKQNLVRGYDDLRKRRTAEIAVESEEEKFVAGVPILSQFRRQR